MVTFTMNKSKLLAHPMPSQYQSHELECVHIDDHYTIVLTKSHEVLLAGVFANLERV